MLVEKIRAMIAPVVDEQRLELVDLLLRNEDVGLVLRVIVYKDSGVGVDDCSKLSREISRILEVEDPIDKAFSLEVSSPGLTRPLVSERDFARNMTKKVKVKYNTNDGPQTVTGIISVASADRIELLSDGVSREVLLAKIIKAKLVIEF